MEEARLQCFFYGEQKNTDEIRRVLDANDLMYEFQKGKMEILSFNKAGDLESLVVEHGDTLSIHPGMGYIVIKPSKLTIADPKVE